MVNSTENPVLNITSNLTSPIDSVTVFDIMSQYVYRIIYVLGFLGNTFTAIVWIRSKHYVSPVCYFIAICISDNLVLLTSALETQHSVNIDAVCQIVHILFLAVQCFAILLVLAMSVERYIEICHPLAAEKMVTLSRTRKTILFLAAMSTSLSVLEGYIWFIDGKSGDCCIRPSLPENFLWIYGFSVLGLFFMCPLISIIIFCSLVLCSVRKARHHSLAYGRSMKPAKSSFNAPFLVISLYLAVSEMIYAFVHLSEYLIPVREHDIPGTPLTGRWRSYYLNSVPLLVADTITLSNYAFDITFFTLSSRTFRQEAVRLIKWQRNSSRTVSRQSSVDLNL